MRLIENLKHKIGMNCLLTSTRDVFEYNGYTFSEDFLYGLGAGLNFWYSNQQGLVQIAGIGSNIFDDFYATTRVIHKYNTFDNDTLAMDIALKFIDYNIPVILDVELISYLPHMESANSQKKSGAKMSQSNDLMHFRVGGHTTLLVGYDTEHVYLYENLFHDLIKLKKSFLMHARNKEVDFIPPHNGMHIFYFPEKIPPITECLRTALSRIVHNMNNSLKAPAYSYPEIYFQSSGLKGIKDFFAEMETWPDKNDEERYHILYTLDQVINRWGNSEVNRITYSRFLREAARMQQSVALDRLADSYADLSRLWKQLQKIIASGIKDKKVFTSEELIVLKKRIYDEEKRLVGIQEEMLISHML